MRQRGVSLLVYLVVLALVAGVGATVVLTYRGAIARAEAAEKARDAIRKEYDAFVDKEAALGLEASKKVEAERKRQKGVSDAKIANLASELASVNAKYAQLRGDAGKGASSGGVPFIPDTSRPADDSARDQRLLDLLQHAENQAKQLIILQDWVRGQYAK